MKARVAAINYDKAVELLQAGDLVGARRAADRAHEFGHAQGAAISAMVGHLVRLQGLLERAERDDPQALYELAVLNICGVGLEHRKIEEGIEYAQLAWDRGRHPRAGALLALVDAQLSYEAQYVALVRCMADSGAPEAQLELAGLLISGDGGNFAMQRDVQQGLDYLRMAADSGYAPAQHTLAELQSELRPSLGPMEALHSVPITLRNGSSSSTSSSSANSVDAEVDDDAEIVDGPDLNGFD